MPNEGQHDGQRDDAGAQPLVPRKLRGPDGFAAWSRVYHDALDSYNGVPLRQGFKEMMAGWDKGWAPKPAEIAPACERARAVLNRPKPGAGVVNMRKVSEEARLLKRVLADDWFRFNGPRSRASSSASKARAGRAT